MASELIGQLLNAGVHFGHQTKRWNPKMKPFIFGSRSGIYIIDLEQTEKLLNAACEFLESVTAKGQAVLFVGTKKQARPLVIEHAEKAGMPYVVNRWLGGTLTNFQTIKQNLERLRELRKQKADGLFDRISKKDAIRFERQRLRLEDSFSGLAEVDRLPGCVFVIDTKREQIAVREALRLKIPIVAICDTNADPEQIQFPIPGNDDAIRAIRLVLGLATESIRRGRERFATQQPVQKQQEEAAPEPAVAAAASAKEPSNAKSSNEG